MTYRRRHLASFTGRSVLPFQMVGLALALAFSGLTAFGTDTVVAQEHSINRCLPGDTPAARLEAFIEVLVGQSPALERIPVIDARAVCPVVLPLRYLDGESFSRNLKTTGDLVWKEYQSGRSLAMIALAHGLDRTAAIEALDTLYIAAVERAVAVGVMTEDQGTRLAEDIGPQFGWLVDYSRGDPIFAGVTDLDGDGKADDLADLLPGKNDEERIASLVQVMVGLPVDAFFDEADALFGFVATDDIWPVLGKQIASILGANSGGPSSQSLYEQYQSGQSLLEIHQQNGGDPESLAAVLMTGIQETIAAEVSGGRLDRVAGQRLGLGFQALLNSVIKHHVGDPLPNDFTVTQEQSATSSVQAETAVVPTCQGVAATLVAVGAGPINGGPWNDVIVGSNGNDTIDGGGGADLICGLDGNDTLKGGQGRDTIYGGRGNDLIYGEGAGVVVTGGADTLYGEDGNDTIVGQIGDDAIYGGNGVDTIEGGDGDDELHGDSGNDDIHGNSGSDELFGGSEDDRLDGDSGSDSCTGGGGSDTFSSC